MNIPPNSKLGQCMMQHNGDNNELVSLISELVMDNKCSCQFTCTVSCVGCLLYISASKNTILSLKVVLVMWLPALWIINDPYFPKGSRLKTAICTMCKSITCILARGLYTASVHHHNTCLACIQHFCYEKPLLCCHLLQMSSENVIEMVSLYLHCWCMYLTLLLVKWAVCICKFVSGGSFVVPRVSCHFVCDSSETPGTWRSISSPEAPRTFQRTVWREHSSSVRTKD